MNLVSVLAIAGVGLLITLKLNLSDDAGQEVTDTHKFESKQLETYHTLVDRYTKPDSAFHRAYTAYLQGDMDAFEELCDELSIEALDWLYENV